MITSERMSATMLASCLWLALTSGSSSSADGLGEEVNQEQLRAAWRIQANEQAMFPLSMQDMPVRIGKHRQLFVDNYLIAEAVRVERRVRPATRYPGNPVLDRGDRSDCVFVLQVRQFNSAPRFRMWYWSARRWHTLPGGQEVRFATSYATSENGIDWDVPELDLFRVEGIADRNVVIPYGLMHGLFHEPDEPDPERRFKALVCVEGRNPTIPEGYYLHTSPDGVHWKADLSHPLIPSLTSYAYPQNGIGDTTRFWWDPLRGRYVGDAKFVLPGKIRCRGIMVSDDLIHWSPPRPTLLARPEGAEIYGHTAFAYEGMYIGTRWIFVHEYDPNTHSMHVELDCSRDGVRWTRVAAGQPFMDINRARTTWDSSRIKPTALLEVDDEIWIYYASGPTALDMENPRLPESQRVPYSAGLAKLKRDRFASIHAGDEPGVLVTRPLTYEGSRLHVNADVAEGGQLRVALVNLSGEEVEGYTLEACQTISGDSIDHVVSWRKKSAIQRDAAERVRLKFELRNAELFSFWIDD